MVLIKQKPEKCFATERQTDFAKMTMSHTVTKINAFLHSKQKLKMAAKNGGKMIFWQKVPDDSSYTL